MIQTIQDTKTYKKMIKESLNNRFLRTALDNFGNAYPQARAKAFENLDFETLRQEIADGKDKALPNLMQLYEIFKKKAEAAGAIVHFAKDATEANKIISSIAVAYNVKLIVKSKSMTAEEIFLNNHLEKAGFKVVETDLGEWIIQLRHEGPSHMVMPAIHLSRSQVSELFTKVTGTPIDPNDINAMVKVARRELRQAFIEADMGISGANFAIAESGTIGIISNEGNARLTTTLPRVHVALVGIEKLVPDLTSAFRIIRVLPKNATGQNISSYVTFITGAIECGSSLSGKKEIHIVFLDNGRLELAKDPVFSESLRCIRCGACANVCPIYRLIGGHTYGHVYIGAIGLILTLFYHGKENAREIVRNCLNCQACKAICASNIDLPYLIKKVYQKILEQESIKPLKNIFLSNVLKNRRLFHFILRQAYLAQKPIAGNEPMIRHLPSFFEKSHGFRSLPIIARVPFRDRWESLYKPVDHPKYRVALFGGCAMDFIYPQQGEALMRLLQKEQTDVSYPLDQTCCGLPVLMASEEETAREVAIQNLKAFKTKSYDYILTLCASCGSHLKENYPKILKEIDLSEFGVSDAWIQEFTSKIIDFSSFMVNVLKATPDDFIGDGKKVAYHAPCHLCRGLHVIHEPKTLLAAAGYTYVPVKDEQMCCGFGGSYSVDFPEISSEILKRKLDQYQASGAGLLVTDCPGCVLQLRGGLDKRGSDIVVKHIVEAIAEKRR